MKTKYSKEKKAEVVAKITAGESVTRVAQEMGVSAASIYQWANHAKAKANRPGPKVITRKKTETTPRLANGITVNLTSDQAISLFEQLASKAFQS